MTLRWLLGRGHRTEAIEEEPTPVGKDAFTDVAPYYDELMSAVPYRSWVDYVESILERVGHEPREVLDLCCGTGQVGAEMARRGYQTVGVDISEPMVRRCSRRQPPLSAAVMDATRPGLAPDSFDLVVSLYDSLNYIVDPEGLQRCFEGVSRALRPRGLLIFDLNTARALRIGLFTQDNINSREPLEYQWRSRWDDERKLCRIDMSFRWRGPGEQVRFSETHYERAYDEDEVREMLARAGLETMHVFDAYTFRRPGSFSNRVYYVARGLRVE
ncbi:MAG: methyltransferase domain-containing protein [Armatimonadota bacterium]|nr:methyltransferase domain-containing protein [Armatimonadota bacterium]